MSNPSESSHDTVLVVALVVAAYGLLATSVTVAVTTSGVDWYSEHQEDVVGLWPRLGVAASHTPEAMLLVVGAALVLGRRPAALRPKTAALAAAIAVALCASAGVVAGIHLQLTRDAGTFFFPLVWQRIDLAKYALLTGLGGVLAWWIFKLPVGELSEQSWSCAEADKEPELAELVD